MSEPKRDDEPTMEEILASIRKIISEDDPETAEAVPAAPAALAEDTPPDADSEGEGPEPMELTQLVSEDGSVVDLRAEKQASSGLHGEQPLAEETAEETAEELSELDRGEVSGSATVEPLVREGTRVHAELVSDDDDGIQLEPREREPAEAELELVAEVEPEIEPDTETELEDVADIEEAQAARTAPEPELESLVSADATAAATAAMSRLKDRLAAGNAFAGGGDRSLEALVRETMAPHLKSWLDRNLPELVERIVREEIEKMVKRTELR
jgi:cell pole-organizing protein PopZ